MNHYNKISPFKLKNPVFIFLSFLILFSPQVLSSQKFNNYKLECTCFGKNNFPLKFETDHGAFVLQGRVLSVTAHDIEFLNYYSNNVITIPKDCIYRAYTRRKEKKLSVEMALLGATTGLLAAYVTYKPPVKTQASYSPLQSWSLFGSGRSALSKNEAMIGGLIFGALAGYGLGSIMRIKWKGIKLEALWLDLPPPKKFKNYSIGVNLSF